MVLCAVDVLRTGATAGSQRLGRPLPLVDQARVSYAPSVSCLFSYPQSLSVRPDLHSTGTCVVHRTGGHLTHQVPEVASAGTESGNLGARIHL